MVEGNMTGKDPNTLPRLDAISSSLRQQIFEI